MYTITAIASFRRIPTGTCRTAPTEAVVAALHARASVLRRACQFFVEKKIVTYLTLADGHVPAVKHAFGRQLFPSSTACYRPMRLFLHQGSW